MPDAISTPGMGAMGIVRALMGNVPGMKGSGKKKKKKTSKRKKASRRKNAGRN